jgi:hypothetical protein
VNLLSDVTAKGGTAMHRTILIAIVVMGLVVFASDVTARNHAVADAEVSKALADIRRASMESDIDALERLLSNDYTFIDAAGSLVPKHEVIDALMKEDRGDPCVDL